MRTSKKMIREIDKAIRFDLPEFRMVERNCGGGINKPYMVLNGERIEFKSNNELMEAALDVAAIYCI